MSSLRLALKQSLEESASGFSPPSASSTAAGAGGDSHNNNNNPSHNNNNNPNSHNSGNQHHPHHHHQHHHHLHAAASQNAPPSPNAHRALASPTHNNSDGVDHSVAASAAAADHHHHLTNPPGSPQQSHRKRGPGRPRKHPLEPSPHSGGGGSHMKKRGRPRKHAATAAAHEDALAGQHGAHHEEDASSSENEFSVDGGGGGGHHHHHHHPHHNEGAASHRDGGTADEEHHHHHHHRDASTTEHDHSRIKMKKKKLHMATAVAGKESQPHAHPTESVAAAGEDAHRMKSSFSSTGSADATAPRKESNKPHASAKEGSAAPAHNNAAPTHEAAEERSSRTTADAHANASSNTTAKAKTVAPPDPRVLQWARNLPIKEARQRVTQGLRVKVRFSTRVKREGKLVRKKKWYGGLVSQVSKAGSKIRIKYDDGTSEVAKFPDKDIVVDDGANGEHQCPADFFVPPEHMEEEKDSTTSAAATHAEDDAASQQDPAAPADEEAPFAFPVAPAAEPPRFEEEKAPPQAAAAGEEQKLPPGGGSFGRLVSDASAAAPSVSTPVEKSGIAAAKEEKEPAKAPASQSSKEPETPAADAASATTTPSTAEHSQQELDATVADSAKPASVSETALMGETDEHPKPKRKRGRPPKGGRSHQEPLTPNPDATSKTSSVSEETMAAAAPPLPLLQSPNPADASFDGLVDTPVQQQQQPEEEKPAKSAGPANSTENNSDVTVPVPKPPLTDAKDEAGPAELEKSPPASTATPKVLAIRIPRQKSNADAEPPKDKPASSSSAKDEPMPDSKETSAATAKKESADKKEAEEPPSTNSTRIHISLKSSAGADKEATATTKGGGRTTPVPAPPLSLKELESEIMTPTSPRNKKSKRKRGDATPNTRSRSPRPPLVGNDSKFQSATTNAPNDKSAEAESVPPQKDNHAAEESAVAKVPQTPRGRQKKEEAARSGRRAAKEANEKISSKDEQVSKKKKKRDRRREVEDPESDREEVQQATWVQCDKCAKWRLVPSDAVGSLPDEWFCADNVWDKKRSSCDAPQQKDKRERKRKKRQRLMEKAERDAPADAASEGSTERESTTASKPPEDTAVAEEGPPPSKRQKKTASNDGSDSSVNNIHNNNNNEPPKTEKKSKKSRAQPSVAAETTETQDDGAATATPVVATVTEAKRGRGRPRRNISKEGTNNPPSANAESNAEGDGDNLEWVQCDKCSKWRKLPPHISADELPDVWYCSLNTWNPSSASCSAPEDKAEAGLTDIFTNGEGAQKLSYRNLIFGNGRKFNRPVSERTRAAESLFASVSEDTDAPPTVPYANSSAFISRSKMNQMDQEPEGLTVLGLMSRTHLWEELRSNTTGPATLDRLDRETIESMKGLILESLWGSKTLSGEEVTNEIQHRDWQGAPLGPHCTLCNVVLVLCSLVKEGVLQCMKEYGKIPEHPDRFVLVYRRNESYSQCSAIVAAAPEEEEAGSHRHTKFEMKKAKHYMSSGHREESQVS